MTQKAMRKMEALCRATERYAPTVEKNISRKGNRETAVVQSAAKYYPALKKLAEK